MEAADISCTKSPARMRCWTDNFADKEERVATAEMYSKSGVWFDARPCASHRNAGPHATMMRSHMHRNRRSLPWRNQCQTASGGATEEPPENRSGRACLNGTALTGRRKPILLIIPYWKWRITGVCWKTRLTGKMRRSVFSQS